MVQPRAILGVFDRHAGIEALGFTVDGPVVDRTMEDAYLETADRRIAAAGLGARIRTELGRRRLTVKSRGTPGRRGIHDRLELEAPIGPGLDPATWPRSKARSALQDAIDGAAVEVIARIRQQRRSLVIARGATLVDLSLDDLEALAPESDSVLARTTELEAELLSGAERDLELLALGLLRLPGLRPATRSKLEWASAAIASAARGG